MAAEGRHFKAPGQGSHPGRSVAQPGRSAARPNHSARPAVPAPSETAQFMAAAASRTSQPRRPVTPGAPPQATRRVPAATVGANPVPPRTPYGRNRRSGAGASDNPPKRRRNILPILLIVIGVALLLIAGGLFIKAQLGYKEAQGTYDKLEQYAVADDSGDGVPTVNFDKLAKINPDVVGWIYIPGTVINYPVVQTDNNKTYLNKLFDQSGNGSGTIFMDMDDAAPGMVDQQTTIYGHHMYDNTMLKHIDDTRDQAVFDSVKTVYYITRDNTYKLKPLFTAQVQDDYGEARTPNFGDEDAFKEYLRTTLSNASAKASDAAERIDGTKQVLSLVTCAGEIIPRTTRSVMVCSLEETTAHQQ